MQNPGSPPASAPLPSQVIRLELAACGATKTGQRRNVFDAPTETLERLHGNITTLNPGETPAPSIAIRRKSW